jgi:polycystin 2
VNNDQQIDFIEWRNNLRAKGYADIEIETLFAKYDLDGDKILNAEEQKNMMKDLAEQNEELKDAIAELEEQAEEYLKEKKISL